MKVSQTRMALGGHPSIGNCLGFREMDEEEFRTVHQLGLEGWK